MPSCKTSTVYYGAVCHIAVHIWFDEKYSTYASAYMLWKHSFHSRLLARSFQFGSVSFLRHRSLLPILTLSLWHSIWFDTLDASFWNGAFDEVLNFFFSSFQFWRLFFVLRSIEFAHSGHLRCMRCVYELRQKHLQQQQQRRRQRTL